MINLVDGLQPQCRKKQHARKSSPHGQLACNAQWRSVDKLGTKPKTQTPKPKPFHIMQTLNTLHRIAPRNRTESKPCKLQTLCTSDPSTPSENFPDEIAGPTLASD